MAATISMRRSVMHALPDEPRAALGFPGTWDGPKLKLAVQSAPLLPRQTLRALLKMQPARPGRRSLMRLADGRAGYPLSGRGLMQGFIARDTLLDLIRMLGVTRADLAPEQVLAAFEFAGLDRPHIHRRLIQVLDERDALELHMSAWVEASNAIPNLHERAASRSEIHDAIWEHWVENTLPEIAPPSGALRLRSIVLSDFPDSLPPFFYQRVSRLELTDIAVSRIRAASRLPTSLDERLALEAFFVRFPDVTSLDIRRSGMPTSDVSPLVFQLPYLIARAFPGLRTLRLINQRLWISRLEVQALSTLQHLEWLDLSGNEASPMEPTQIVNLRLRYLGLDNIGLYTWPAWLQGLESSQISELSLRNNRITAIPWDVHSSQQTSGQPAMQIALQGNPLSRVALMRIRLEETPSSRFHFGLDMPPHLQAHVRMFRDERVQLQEAIDHWAQASSSSRPLSQATVDARQRIGQTLLTYWRTCAEGETSAVLHLERISLEDFPRLLPAFFWARVRGIRLTNVEATTSLLNQFLARLQQLTSLEMTGQTPSMPDLPTALLDLPALTTLRLVDQGRDIDQRAMDFFARLGNLQTLDLTGNRVRNITIASGLRNTLHWLNLTNTGLDRWPDWIDGLLPLGGVVLDNNQLTELPEHILSNPRGDYAQTEISLWGNPLTYETLRRAHVSERYGSSYSFAIEVPDDIAALTPEPDYSDSESTVGDYLSDSNSSGSRHLAQALSPQEAPDVERWLTGSVDENQAHRALWQRIETAGDAPELMALIGRLVHAAPYRTASTRGDFAERVWRVLAVADQNPESRLLYNGIAQGALLQQETGSRTCHDGAWLVFNQIEIQMFVAQSLRDAPTLLRGQTLYRLTRRLYRLHELDAVALEQAGTRDEAEVRLAYRLRWSAELDLPLPPGSMLYQVHAGIRAGELDSALARVQQGEYGEPFMRYAAQRDFWVEYLRESYAERFDALKQNYLAQVVALPDRFPGRAIDELSEEFAALKHEFDTQELNLIRELTYREGFNLS